MSLQLAGVKYSSLMRYLARGRRRCDAELVNTLQAGRRTTLLCLLQKDVYRAAGKPLVDALFDGFDCALLAYGQTGAGKT